MEINVKQGGCGFRSKGKLYNVLAISLCLSSRSTIYFIIIILFSTFVDCWLLIVEGKS